ncbi:hypothetical protein Tco_1409131 [Tanacetum coccineum]
MERGVCGFGGRALCGLGVLVKRGGNAERAQMGGGEKRAEGRTCGRNVRGKRWGVVEWVGVPGEQEGEGGGVGEGVRVDGGGLLKLLNQEYAARIRGKLIQKLLLNQKCMGYLVRAYYSISPTKYYKDDSCWSADLKLNTTEDVISI